MSRWHYKHSDEAGDSFLVMNISGLAASKSVSDHEPGLSANVANIFPVASKSRFALSFE